MVKQSSDFGSKGPVEQAQTAVVAASLTATASINMAVVQQLNCMPA